MVKKWDVEYTENYEIEKYSTIGIGPFARLAIFPKKCSDFANCLLALYLEGYNFKVVGALSNVLFTGSFFDGVIVNTLKMNKYFVAENCVDVECGARMSKLIRQMAALSLGGLEALYGIPGSLGGMVYSNAGAYGASISDFLEYAAVLDLKAKKIRRLYKDELDFSYRHSAFCFENIFLLYARINFSNASKAETEEKLRAVIEKRKATQPYSEKSLGSIFKRQGDIPISRLIDEAGLKGLSVGDAEVSKKHAGFIINKRNASADDVIKLIALIKNELFSRYAVMPSEEIEII